LIHIYCCCNCGSGADPHARNPVSLALSSHLLLLLLLDALLLLLLRVLLLRLLLCCCPCCWAEQHLPQLPLDAPPAG
jgi:hypothetical protein